MYIDMYIQVYTGVVNALWPSCSRAILSEGMSLVRALSVPLCTRICTP